MTPREREYRKAVNRIGVTMLIFYGAFFAFSFMIAIVGALTSGLDFFVGTVIYETVYGLGYAAAFLLPALLFFVMFKKKGARPITAGAVLPRATPIYIIVGIAIINAAAQCNSILLELFEYASYSEENFFTNSTTHNFEVVLMVFTTAIVPGFVEEILFRGVILTNLKPFGRTTAVLGSALLFALMHQNPGQLLYAFVAGVVLGYVYVYTESLWCCVLIHFCNNFLGVLQFVLMERLPLATANLVLYLMNTAIFALGILGAIYLILKQRDRHGALLLSGTFETEVEADPEYAKGEIPLGRRVRLFFSPIMIVFASLCVAQMAIFLLASLAA